MSLQRLASRHIQPTTGRVTTKYEDGDIDDIIEVILEADRLSAVFTKPFARFLRQSSDIGTLKQVWTFVKKNIRYVRDSPGHEVIKSPGKTWQDRRIGSDCKSFSVMIGSLLKNLGYAYFYRVAFYDPATPDQGHIYPVAVLPSGRKVVVDAVHRTFNEEVPFWKAYDYHPQTGQRISGYTTQNQDFWSRVIENVMLGLATYGVLKLLRHD